MSQARALRERFEIESELGRGAMGVVWKARERETGRRVAIKMGPQVGNDAQRERFRREGELTARLNHPGVVRVHAYGDELGKPWIAYELVEGGSTFEEALRRSTPEEVAALVRDAARALGAAHELGIVHRDVKPANVLLDGDDRVRVADFGLATAGDLERLTLTGALLGTPSYMSPEQLGGLGGVGPSADVWALGVILYEALTGRLPFEGSSLFEHVAAVEAGRFTPPRAIDPELPVDLEAVCLRALAGDPGRRYADGTALADDLQRYLDGEAIAAQPSRALWVVAGAAALLIVGVAAGIAIASASREPEVAAATPAATPRASSTSTADPLAALRERAAGGDPAAVEAYADALIEAGLPSKARRQLEGIAARRPTAMLRLARLLDEEEAPEALGWWRTLSESEDPDCRIAALLRLGDEAVKQRKPVEAIRHWRGLCSLGWDATRLARERLGKLVRAGGPAKSRAWLTKLELSKHDPPLGRLCLGGASASGTGGFVDTPAWMAARHAWLSKGVRAGDPICAVWLLEWNRRRDVPVQSELVALVENRVGDKLPEALTAKAILHMRGLGLKKSNRAARNLLRRAHKQHPPALYWLGVIYRDGRGVRPNGETAAKWLRRAHARNVAPALPDLICLLASGRSVPVPETELLTLVEQAAKRGIPWAKPLLPPSTPRRYPPQAKQMLEAAERGDSLAVLAVGTLLFDDGRSGDVLRGLQILGREAKRGSTEVMFRLGERLYQHLGDEAGSAFWYAKAVKAGSARAMVKLGQLYARGSRAAGLDRNPKRAAELYAKAAERKDGLGTVLLGQAYRDGFGVTRDPHRSRALFERALKTGQHREGRTQLVHLLLHRKTFGEEGLRRAVELVRGLIKEGVPDGLMLMGELQLDGRGVRRDEAAGWAKLTRAAKFNAYAQYRLGVRRYQAAKTDAEREVGLRWIRRAGKAGVYDARNYLFRLQRRALED